MNTINEQNKIGVARSRVAVAVVVVAIDFAGWVLPRSRDYALSPGSVNYLSGWCWPTITAPRGLTFPLVHALGQLFKAGSNTPLVKTGSTGEPG